MNTTEVAAALCGMPRYLREHPETSLAARLREILASRQAPVREADLVTVLSGHRDLIDAWAGYVQDQRTSDGWYVASPGEAAGEPSQTSEWILARRGRKERVAFDSPSAAYAALILRMIARGILSPGPGRD